MAACFEMVCELGAGGFVGEADAIAISPDGSTILASPPTSTSDVIAAFDFPSGTYDSNFATGWDPTYDSSGEVWWARRAGSASPNFTNEVLRGATEGGASVLYTTGGRTSSNRRVHLRGGDSVGYLTESNSNGASQNAVKSVTTGSTVTTLATGSSGGGDAILMDRPTITSDGAVWWMRSYPFPDHSICRYDGSEALHTTDPVFTGLLIPADTSTRFQREDPAASGTYLGWEISSALTESAYPCLDCDGLASDTPSPLFVDFTVGGDGTVYLLQRSTRRIWRLASRRRFWVGSTGFSR